MKYHFEFRPYRRRFKQPLKTSHGWWEVREGIILRLTDEMSNAGFGEIAPLTWFGSESFEQALDFCHQLPSKITTNDVFAVPSELPASQFGFESAWEETASQLQFNQFQTNKVITFSALLPAGKAALDRWRLLWNKGYRTFKWKIGVASFEDEIKLFYQLAEELPSKAKLRLDANCGLTLAEASEWLRACDQVGIEFLEQPLPADQLTEMIRLSEQYSTPLALDESVANIEQLKACYQHGWRGLFVIKPAIAGSPKLLRHLCQKYDIDVVFSSVFETPIGKYFGLRLSLNLAKNNRAAGFGVAHWFTKDDLFSESETTSFQLCKQCKLSFQDIWKHLYNT